MAKSYGCGDCKFRSELQPGCNNNTCYIWGENPIKKMYHDGSEVAEDVLTVGSSPGVLVTSPRFIFTCRIDPYMLEKLAKGVTGVAGFGQTTPITVPNQLGSDPRFSRKFGMCLSSSTTSRGVIFIGPNPYYVYNPKKIDISNSKDLAYTKLLVNKRGFLQTDEYYFQMSSIRVAGQDVPLNKTLLIINKKRHGTDGTSISTAIPYTILHTTFYDSVKTAFINALPKNVTIVEPPPMSPFATCFSSENIKNTNVGPDVPPIDIVFYKPSVFWRISGANSMIQVSKDVMCLAFVRQDQTWLPSIVIGGYQLEENLLVFDLPGRKIGFSSSLKLKQTSCSQYDNTIMDKDVLAIGSSPGVRVTWSRFIFTCVESYLSRRLANGVIGIAGFGHESPLHALDPTLNKKFGVRLSSSTRSRGVIFIGSGPYYVYNPKKVDISKDLVYTKVITNRGFLLSEKYYIQVSSIRIVGQEALPKNVTLVEPPMKQFGVCFSSKNIRSTKVGPDVPVIDFVLHKPSAFWRIYGANSVVQVKKDVMCLAFVGRDQTWEPSIVIGGYQLEENLLVFDLSRKKKAKPRILSIPHKSQNPGDWMNPSEYHVKVSSIRIAGKEVPLNKTLLFVNEQGNGGTRISTTTPFTILDTSIYEAVKTAFIKALPKNVTMVDSPTKRFGACFSSKNIRSTNVGPDVPVINFVFHKPSAFWRIYGTNSVVQVSKDVMCLAFAGQDQSLAPSIVIGGHQLEENLLIIFDFPHKKIGFSSSLKLQQTSCSKYDNISKN
ncbi:hypothetical protein H5410_013119 [Solanum commersonii]|uniref:Peptidase A1 domain-containing protein n=1 Tax=Solanum commersonii TaxID=4109 RepID=A0A9J6ATK1_SOLCO|nr:hypothetical protein H5410_013119 [Solanum commersonii]